MSGIILDQIYVGQCCSSHEIPPNDNSAPGERAGPGPKLLAGLIRCDALTVAVCGGKPLLLFLSSESITRVRDTAP